jgi:hypothetical protein
MTKREMNEHDVRFEDLGTEDQDALIDYHDNFTDDYDDEDEWDDAD